MDEFIELYIKKRKQKIPLFIDLLLGIILLFYTFAYCGLIEEIDVWQYLNIFFIILVVFIIVKQFVILCFIYDKSIRCKNFLNLKKVYKQKIDRENIKYINEAFKNVSKKEISIFYNYLCDTSQNLDQIKVREYLLTGAGFIIGASFDANASISTTLLSNALKSVSGFALGLLPFYIIFIQIYNSYTKIFNNNVIKKELIYYINQINYNETTKELVEFVRKENDYKLKNNVIHSHKKTPFSNKKTRQK